MLMGLLGVLFLILLVTVVETIWNGHYFPTASDLNPEKSGG